jgi:hypothetical protein
MVLWITWKVDGMFPLLRHGITASFGDVRLRQERVPIADSRDVIAHEAS